MINLLFVLWAQSPTAAAGNCRLMLGTLARPLGTTKYSVFADGSVEYEARDFLGGVETIQITTATPNREKGGYDLKIGTLQVGGIPTIRHAWVPDIAYREKVRRVREQQLELEVAQGYHEELLARFGAEVKLYEQRKSKPSSEPMNRLLSRDAVLFSKVLVNSEAAMKLAVEGASQLGPEKVVALMEDPSLFTGTTGTDEQLVCLHFVEAFFVLRYNSEFDSLREKFRLGVQQK